MYQIPGLLKYPKLFHAFSEKTDGNMANSILGKVVDFDKVLDNRKRFLSSIKVLIDTCVCMWVLGEDGVLKADEAFAGVSMENYKKAIKIDALITNQTGLYPFLLTADCEPVIIFDTSKKAIGLVHVGWKGADLEIVKKVIGRMKDEYGAVAEDLIVGIGPHASRASFVKDNPSQIDDSKWQPFLEKVIKDLPERAPRAQGYKVDFAGLVRQQLIQSGIRKENIFESNIDTVKDSRFFSHVREGNLPLSKQGRFACVVGLKS